MKENQLPRMDQNPKGLHQRYFIRKITKVVTGQDFFGNPTFASKLKNVDPEAEYFVLRLDKGGSDIEHIKAGRIGIHAYADAIEHHLPELSKDLKERYPLL